MSSAWPKRSKFTLANSLQHTGPSWWPIKKMEDWSKFYALTRFFPEARPADQLTHNRQKVIYTTISLFIILIANQLPLYGIPVQKANVAPDPLNWDHPFYASNGLLALGIGPILLSEFITLILVASKATNVDITAPDVHSIQSRKLMGILFTIIGAIARLLGLCLSGKVATDIAVIVFLQILFSGIVVIYLDEILKKGYGLLSSVSLFTAATICGNIVWKAFSPVMLVYPEGDTEFEGAVPAWVHLVITRTDKSSAMREAFYRQNLPNVTNLLATCLFVLVAVSFQVMSSVVLPVRTNGVPRFQVSCLIKISNILYGPIILHRLLVTFMYNISELLCIKYGGNKLLNLLGTWNRPNHFQQPFLVGGILYYITTPPTLADLYRAPFHAFIYVVYVLGACAYLSVFWLRLVCAPSTRSIDGFIVSNEEQRVLAQPDSIPLYEFNSHVLKAARLGGFCVGGLIILGDFIGVFGSGTGIMLAVTALYPYFDGRAGEVGAFGF